MAGPRANEECVVAHSIFLAERTTVCVPAAQGTGSDVLPVLASVASRPGGAEVFGDPTIDPDAAGPINPIDGAGAYEFHRDAARGSANIVPGMSPSMKSDQESERQQVDRWRLVREIGNGGMGTVWLAERADGAFRMNAALKVLRHQIVDDEAIQMFHRERQILADLSHPNICRLMDGGTMQDGRPYLVMEFVDGQRLSEYCTLRKQSTQDILQIFIKLCGALSCAHARGVVHRDLKPSNVLVTAAGEPKLLDFGIASARGPDFEGPPSVHSNLRLTPRYASPEQWAGHAVGPTSDVFSLGVMLLEALVGELPGGYAALGVASPAVGEEALSESLRAVIFRALHMDHRERYPSIEAFADALRSQMGPENKAHSSSVERAARVYICCRIDVERDVDVALEINNALAAVGVASFLAPNVVDNRAWVTTVMEALCGCDAFVLLLSRQAMVSEMVQGELELAWHLQQENNGKPYILAVFIPDSDETVTQPNKWPLMQEIDRMIWQASPQTQAVVTKILDKLGLKTGRRIDTPTPRIARTLRPRMTSISRRPSKLVPDLPGDIVRADSPYYMVRRGLEDRCLDEIVRPGALVRIKGPRQMGKTSLMMRLLDHGREHGARTVAINLEMADRQMMGDLNRFLRWLCAVVTRRLDLPTHRIDESWDEMFGAKDNCTAYFEECLLQNGPVVLALDHVDRLFEYPAIVEEFFTLLRAWHEFGKSQDPWPNLRLILVYATEMYVPMNINRSPFNVGFTAALSEWDVDLVNALALRHDAGISRTDVERLMTLLGGHPHLSRIALYHMAAGTSIDDILAHAATDEGLFADHLKHLLWHLEVRPELAQAAAMVMAADGPVRLNTEMAFKLTSMGLVQLDGNEVRPARELYRRYLLERLSVKHPA